MVFAAVGLGGFEAGGIVAMDAEAVRRAHRARQRRQRLAAGPAWVDTGLVFTTPTGQAVYPAAVPCPPGTAAHGAAHNADDGLVEGAGGRAGRPLRRAIPGSAAASATAALRPT